MSFSIKTAAHHNMLSHPSHLSLFLTKSYDLTKSKLVWRSCTSMGLYCCSSPHLQPVRSPKRSKTGFSITACLTGFHPIEKHRVCNPTHTAITLLHIQYKSRPAKQRRRLHQLWWWYSDMPLDVNITTLKKDYTCHLDCKCNSLRWERDFALREHLTQISGSEIFHGDLDEYVSEGHKGLALLCSVDKIHTLDLKCICKHTVLLNANHHVW